MTTDQPMQDFRVKSSLLNDSSPLRVGGGNPKGPEPPDTPTFWQLPGGAYGRPLAWLAGMGFVALYSVSQRYAQAIPVTIVALVACVLLRLNGRERQFAAVPVAVAGMKLALNLAGRFAKLPFPEGGPAATFSNVSPQGFGLNWLPLFLAICLFYMPMRTSITTKITLTCSVVLLVSGLTPGDGYLYIFAIVQMMLFVAIGVGLILDFIPKQGNALNGNAFQGAR